MTTPKNTKGRIVGEVEVAIQRRIQLLEVNFEEFKNGNFTMLREKIWEARNLLDEMDKLATASAILQCNK